MIILLQLFQLLSDDSINLLLRLIHKLSEYLHDSFEILLLFHFCLYSISLQMIQKAFHNKVQTIDLTHITQVIIITMIELEESINSAQIGQINAQRMRKSSRLLRDSKSQQRVNPKSVETGKLTKLGHRYSKNWNWQHQKYSELLKLMSFQRKEERQEEKAVKTLDHSNHRVDYFSQHFKGSWKPSLESEMLISHCKNQRANSRYPTQSSCQQYRYKSRHQCIYFRKDRSSELNLFKSQIRNSCKRKQGNQSRPSFIKHMLKIEDQPLRLEDNAAKSQEQMKTNITLQPLKNVRQRLTSLSPQKPRQIIQDKKSLPLMFIQKRNHAIRKFGPIEMRVSDVSAWTFHNIEQN